MITSNQIEIIAKIINQTVMPEAVYLFGSYASGTAHVSSDLDIAIVKNNIKDKHEDLYKIRKALSYLAIPMDLLLFEAKDYISNVDVYGTVQYEIAHKGTKLS